MLEATALPTEPQPLHNFFSVLRMRSSFNAKIGCLKDLVWLEGRKRKQLLEPVWDRIAISVIMSVPKCLSNYVPL